MTRDHPRRIRLGLGSLALAGAAAIGAIVVSLASLPLPLSVQDAPSPQEISVSTVTFGDERAVDVTIIRSSVSPVAAPASGVLTSYDCTVGSQVASGGSFFALDGEPVLALATEVPPWRDLAVGDTGADVRSLQAELRRLGYTVDVDGNVGGETLRAGFQALAAIGVEWHGSTFPLSRIVWMPAQQASLGTCDSTLGARATGGDPIASFTSGHHTLTVDNLPNDLVHGPRVVTIGTDAIPVDPNGRSGPLPSHADVRATDTGVGEASAQKPIAATLSLAEPALVSSVPPSAIVGLHGTVGCVESSGTLHHVQVVGSQLGQTFVEFQNGESPHRIRLDPIQRRCP